MKLIPTNFQAGTLKKFQNILSNRQTQKKNFKYGKLTKDPS